MVRVAELVLMFGQGFRVALTDIQMQRHGIHNYHIRQHIAGHGNGAAVPLAAAVIGRGIDNRCADTEGAHLAAAVHRGHAGLAGRPANRSVRCVFGGYIGCQLEAGARIHRPGLYIQLHYICQMHNKPAQIYQ